jgi:uncharacterized protein (DUF2126 family)
MPTPVSTYSPDHLAPATRNWAEVDALAEVVEQSLSDQKVDLLMGGEPTFVADGQGDRPEWQIEALGAEKRRLAGELLQRLAKRFKLNGPLLLYGTGKLYPGEAEVRWALGCYWRLDGTPLWHASRWLATDTDRLDPAPSLGQVETFMRRLAERLGIPQHCLQSTYEPETERVAGFSLPLLAIAQGEGAVWSSCHWQLPDLGDRLVLLPGDYLLGLRLPLGAIAPRVDLVDEAIADLDEPPVQAGDGQHLQPPNSIRIALTAEIRDGQVCLFLPPLQSPRAYVDLLAALEAIATELQLPVRLNGFLPPISAHLRGFQLTPDPGVLEANIQPAETWSELCQIHRLLYDEAHACGLTIAKYSWEGFVIGTGGGAHLTLGGRSVETSPLLRRPDLLRSLMTYWQQHPSLSYLFSGLFIGATSQAPRIDEARHESLYELEIAFETLQPFQAIAPGIVDRLLRNLLVDISGNTHRSEFCIDKLYPLESRRQQLGILELRAMEMPPSLDLRLLQCLLVRAFVAWFWRTPYTGELIRWGTTLHDRFLLPHYVHQDFETVLADLQTAGFAFQSSWFEPFFDFRFPVLGRANLRSEAGPLQLELRRALEPWPVLGEAAGGGTARPVDTSMDRVEVRLRGVAGPGEPDQDLESKRYALICNGLRVPLNPAESTGELIGAVRFRARRYNDLLHPGIMPHSPLTFWVIDTEREANLGGCRYFASHPTQSHYESLPHSASEAERRCQERFQVLPPGPPTSAIALNIHPDFPLTLDLRRSTAGLASEP